MFSIFIFVSFITCANGSASCDASDETGFLQLKAPTIEEEHAKEQGSNRDELSTREALDMIETARNRLAARLRNVEDEPSGSPEDSYRMVESAKENVEALLRLLRGGASFDESYRMVKNAKDNVETLLRIVKGGGTVSLGGGRRTGSDDGVEEYRGYSTKRFSRLIAFFGDTGKEFAFTRADPNPQKNQRVNVDPGEHVGVAKTDFEQVSLEEGAAISDDDAPYYQNANGAAKVVRIWKGDKKFWSENSECTDTGGDPQKKAAVESALQEEARKLEQNAPEVKYCTANPQAKTDVVFHGSGSNLINFLQDQSAWQEKLHLKSPPNGNEFEAQVYNCDTMEDLPDKGGVNTIDSSNEYALFIKSEAMTPTDGAAYRMCHAVLLPWNDFIRERDLGEKVG
eukprot:gnl/TRDRNA2_/TRDRNA2_160726_c0_seq2.p1 gnl/TRDRNA2_/TRDRNA2_160726_c0~~gnl/TRDRNA2_/TRDRNA2_160726_c0_seq2.p1  ORF type:complete len:398 (-),score=51.33 gnl/TRDRNA2_/TRDRNA2_160726_c0_seq2:69-1262(-)